MWRPELNGALGGGGGLSGFLLPHVSEWQTLCAGAGLFV